MSIKYPDVSVDLEGVNGNAFAVAAAVSRAITKAYGPEAAHAYRNEAFASESYDALLQHAMGTVDLGYGDELEA